ncbi:MAG: GNAT family N-acetyltransferase [Chloroflexota bacterium]|nr:GNAT family N-acetyltransferase [Chloroflexota bacterium]
MRGVSYRPMTEADLSATTLVRKAANEWLARSEGRDVDPHVPDRPLPQRHLLRTDPAGSWVAELNDVVVGCAQGYVRGEIWYLSQFFVLPEAQSLGIGHELLVRVQADGRERGARVLAVTASTSQSAHGLYMRHGMHAIGVGYRLSGPIAPLRSLPEPARGQAPVADCGGVQGAIAGLDREVWGAERRQEHALFLAGGFAEQETSFALTSDGTLLGYGYAMDDGHIGPLAARSPETQLPLLRTAVDWLTARGVERGYCYCLSLNPTLMRAFLDAGWRIGGWSFLLASEPFGQFDRYLPSGGLLL